MINYSILTAITLNLQPGQVKAAIERDFYAPRRRSADGNVFVFRPAAGALEEPMH